MANETNEIRLVPRNISFPELTFLGDKEVFEAYQEGIKNKIQKIKFSVC